MKILRSGITGSKSLKAFDTYCQMAVHKDQGQFSFLPTGQAGSGLDASCAPDDKCQMRVGKLQSEGVVSGDQGGTQAYGFHFGCHGFFFFLMFVFVF